MLPWFVVVGEAFTRRGLMLFFPHILSCFLSLVFVVGVFVHVGVGKKQRTLEICNCFLIGVDQKQISVQFSAKQTK